LFDTHCHFNLDEFYIDLENIIRVSEEIGVDRFLVPGVDLGTSERSLLISRRYPGMVFSAVGIHPSYSNQSDAKEIMNIIEANRDEIVAIGEIGLDFYRDYSPREKQQSTLNEMLTLAREYNLPICLHNRDADAHLLKTLDVWYQNNIQNANPTGVFHAYDGSEMIVDWAIKHGFYLGIGGMITYKKNEALREQVRNIGADHIVLETDSPYLTPAPCRRECNFPGNLRFVVETLSKLLGIEENEVITKTDENALKLFGLNKKSR